MQFFSQKTLHYRTEPNKDISINGRLPRGTVPMPLSFCSPYSGPLLPLPVQGPHPQPQTHGHPAAEHCVPSVLHWLTDWHVNKTKTAFMWSTECFARFALCTDTLVERAQSNKSVRTLHRKWLRCRSSDIATNTEQNNQAINIQWALWQNGSVIWKKGDSTNRTMQYKL